MYLPCNVREIDGAQILVRSLLNFTHMIPANSREFITTAHCSPLCTNELPQDGINVFMMLLHAHVSGELS